MADILNIEILEDGTMKIDSGKVSGVNHMSAEGFLRTCIDLMKGCKVSRLHKAGAMHSHTHEDGHTHSHA